MKTLVIGLTGPSGAGKTNLSEYFKSLGFTCLNADEIYHETIKRGRPCFDALIGYFGEEIIGKDGEIDRRKLGKLVFSDAHQLIRLEKITHPFVVKDIEREIQKAIAKGGVLLDAPTLFEAGAHKLCNKTIALLGNKEVRLARIMKRDNITKEMALKRMNNQKTDKYYKERADFSFDGTVEFEVLTKQVREMLTQLSGEYRW